jgi:hypothetical protein
MLIVQHDIHAKRKIQTSGERAADWKIFWLFGNGYSATFIGISSHKSATVRVQHDQISDELPVVFP